MRKLFLYGPWIIIILITVLVIIAGSWFIDLSMEITDIETSQTKRMATSLYLSKLESIGKISLAIIGVLWALILYEGAQIRLSDSVEINLFLVTNLSFLISFIIYFIGHDFLLNYIFYHATIDFESPVVEFFRWGQLTYFIMGLLFFCFTVYFGRKPATPTQDDNKK